MRDFQTKPNEGDFGITEGSDNIFADLGFPDARAHLEKARLALKISQLIQSRKLTQAKAAVLMSTDQPKVSKLMRGVVREFSLEKLMEFAERLGLPHEVTEKQKGSTVVSIPEFQYFEITHVSQPAAVYRLSKPSNVLDFASNFRFLSSPTVQSVY
jgi:predicted XRE-type DNA-binding protein